MRPGSPLRLQPPRPGATTHAAPTLRHRPADGGSRPAPRRSAPSAGSRPDHRMARRPRVVDGRDDPSGPGRKAHNCCLSGGTDGVSPEGPERSGGRAKRVDTPSGPQLFRRDLPRRAAGQVNAPGRPTPEAAGVLGASRRPGDRAAPTHTHLRRAGKPRSECARRFTYWDRFNEIPCHRYRLSAKRACSLLERQVPFRSRTRVISTFTDST